MDLKVNGTILCDWIDIVEHYNIPDQIRLNLENECRKNRYKFEMICDPIASTREDVVACIGNRFDHTILKFLPNLRWVHYGSIGTEKIPQGIASKHNLLITNSRDIFETAVARHTLMLILRSLSTYQFLEQNFNRKFWEMSYNSAWNEINFLLLGSGPIAQKLNTFLKFMNLNSFVVYKDTQDCDGDEITHRKLSKFKNKKICIVNLLPGNCDGFVNEKYLSGFTEIHAYINVGRSNTEILADIKNLLKTNRLKYAAWDVIRDEKLVSGMISEFNDRVYFTPHIASFNESHWKKSGELALHNLRNFLNGHTKKLCNICYV